MGTRAAYRMRTNRHALRHARAFDTLRPAGRRRLLRPRAWGRAPGSTPPHARTAPAPPACGSICGDGAGCRRRRHGGSACSDGDPLSRSVCASSKPTKVRPRRGAGVTHEKSRASASPAPTSVSVKAAAKVGASMSVWSRPVLPVASTAGDRGDFDCRCGVIRHHDRRRLDRRQLRHPRAAASARAGGGAASRRRGTPTRTA